MSGAALLSSRTLSGLLAQTSMGLFPVKLILEGHQHKVSNRITAILRDLAGLFSLLYQTLKYATMDGKKIRLLCMNIGLERNG